MELDIIVTHTCKQHELEACDLPLSCAPYNTAQVAIIILTNAFIDLLEIGEGDPKLSGPVIKIDLPLWISHVLNEAELATGILDLAAKHVDDSKTLKERVLALCKMHEAKNREKMLEKQ